MNQAPRFVPGDGVRWSGRGIEGTVRRVQVLASGVHYVVHFGGGRGPELVREADLEPVSSDPISELLAGNLEDAADFALRVAALRLSYAYAYDGAVCLSNSRLEPQAHQVFVAHRALQQLAPRFLLADEVGLGKTIEAGLILKELRARGLVRRALIIAPANLVEQWRYEMRSKFNEIFVPYTRQHLTYLQTRQPGQNPWLADPNIIVSRTTVARRHAPGADDLATLLQEVDWDIVIVDEAHHARRYQDRATLAYSLVAGLRTKSLLLLTATPLQLHDFEMYSLIDLLDPALFETYEDFVEYTSTTGQYINKAVGELQRWPELEDRERKALGADCVSLLQRPVQLTDAVAVEECAGALIDRHRVGQVMVRNRKRVIGGFADRQASLIPISLSPRELELYQRVSTYVQEQYALAKAQDNRALGFVMVTFQRLLASSSRALAAALGRRADRLEAAWASGASDDDPEDLEDEVDAAEVLPDRLQIVAGHASDWSGNVALEVAVLRQLVNLARQIGCDTKLQRLTEEIRALLREDTKAKILVFTTYRDTLEYVRAGLRDVCEAAVFHGGLNQIDKEAQVERFRGPVPVMISTEAGGEGRNFQFCHILFNYDLPWNPMKVEQRIGRIDRIGQRHKVCIFNFAAPETVEGRIVERLHARIGLFEQTVGGLDPILDGEVTRTIEEFTLQGGTYDKAEIEQFTDKIELLVKRARRREEQLQDFVMGLNGFRRDEADRLLRRQPEVSNEDLQRFVFAALARFPLVESPRALGDECWRLNLPLVLQTKLREHSYGPATFSPQVAVRQEKVDFVAFGHPLVDALIAYCVAPGRGSRATIRRLADPDLSDFEGLQVVYTVEYTGIRPTKRLHCVVIDRELHSDPDLSRRILFADDEPLAPAQGPLFRTAPQPTPRIKGIWELGQQEDQEQAARESLPPTRLIRHSFDETHIYRCRTMADEVLDRQMEAEREYIAMENERMYDRERARLMRVHGYQCRRAEQDLFEASEILRRHQASTDPGERRVVPLDKQRVEDRQAAQAETERMHEEELRVLEEGRFLTYSITVEAVAFVYGPG